VIEKNQGLKNLKIIRDIHQGLNPTELLDVELTPLDVVNMMYVILSIRQLMWDVHSVNTKTFYDQIAAILHF